MSLEGVKVTSSPCTQALVKARGMTNVAVIVAARMLFAKAALTCPWHREVLPRYNWLALSVVHSSKLFV